MPTRQRMMRVPWSQTLYHSSPRVRNQSLWMRSYACDSSRPSFCLPTGRAVVVSVGHWCSYCLDAVGCHRIASYHWLSKCIWERESRGRKERNRKHKRLYPHVFPINTIWRLLSFQFASTLSPSPSLPSLPSFWIRPYFQKRQTHTHTAPLGYWN